MKYYLSYVVFEIFVLFLGLIGAAVFDNTYEAGDSVLLWFELNNVEGQQNFTFPICHGPIDQALNHRTKGLFELSQKSNYQPSGLDIRFNVNVTKTKYCSEIPFGTHRNEILRDYGREYSFSVYLDDLNTSGYLGVWNGTIFSIFTHMALEIWINKAQMVKFQMLQSELLPVNITDSVSVTFTYEVNWKQSDVLFMERHDLHYEKFVNSMKIRKLALINSLVMLLFVMLFLIWILLRTLRIDISRYNNSAIIDRDSVDEYGWKLVHDDVFRSPPHLLALSCIVGTGVQCFLTLFLTLLLSHFIISNKSGLTALVLYMYASVSPISAFCSAAIYKKYGGQRWKQHTSVHLSAFPLFILAIIGGSIWFQHNHITLHLPLNPHEFFGVAPCISLLLVIPLSLIGSIIAKSRVSCGNFPCHVSDVPGPIPRKKWFLHLVPISLISSILPFGCIAIEVYFVIQSFWSTKIHLVYHFMCAILIIMVMLSASTSIICTYLYLNAEDYRWHWMSFSTGFCVGIYCYSYLLSFRTFGKGVFPIYHYPSYHLLVIFICSMIGLICGAFNFLSASLFVHKLYDSIKLK